MKVVEPVIFIGNRRVGILFSIQCKHGQDITEYSILSDEEEITLLPGTCFEILGQMQLNNNMTIVNMKEIEPPIPLLPFVWK